MLARGRTIGIFGPSYVGKTTFVHHLAGSGYFRHVPVLTTRPPRDDEIGSGTFFVSEADLRAKVATGKWLTSRIGSYLYGFDLDLCIALNKEHHVIFEIAPTTKTAFQRELPELITVLLWPADFEQLQAELSRAFERPSIERAERLRRNEQDARAGLDADLTLYVERLSNAAARDAQWDAMEGKILASLEKRR
jgi:guanylate kinase